MPHTLIRRHFFRSLFFLSSPSYLLFFALPCLCFSRRQNERVIAIYRSNTGEKRRNEGARQTIALRDNARRRCFADAFKIIGGFSNGEFFSPFSPFFFFFFFWKKEKGRGENKSRNEDRSRAVDPAPLGNVYVFVYHKGGSSLQNSITASVKACSQISVNLYTRIKQTTRFLFLSPAYSLALYTRTSSSLCASHELSKHAKITFQRNCRLSVQRK